MTTKDTPARQPSGLSASERQARFRAKRADAGLTEVRGIFLPPDLHAALKRAADGMGSDAASPDRTAPADAHRRQGRTTGE